MARGTEVTFWDHLEEARWGFLRSLIYIAVGTAAAWAFRQQMFELIRHPAMEGARRAGITEFNFRIFDPAGGVVLMMQVALIAGVVATAPLWLAEAVRFVAPGLEPRERRAAYLLLPGAVLLFLGGVGFCYLIAPAAFAFLFGFNQSLGVAPEVALVSYLYFFMRLVLVFGLVFELPLVIMFLVHFGILTTAKLLRAWRLALVIIMVVAAVATPTTDPFTMVLMAGPMVLLYFLSIALGRLVERRREVEPEASPGDGDDPYGLAAVAGMDGLTPPPGETFDSLPRSAGETFVDPGLLDPEGGAQDAPGTEGPDEPRRAD